MVSKPKIVIWDVETIPLIAATFSLYPDSINHESILSDWSIVCASYKTLGKKKTKTVSVLDDPKRFKKNVNDDYHVIKTLRDEFEDVDILVHHNGDAFDNMIVVK